MCRRTAVGRFASVEVGVVGPAAIESRWRPAPGRAPAARSRTRVARLPLTRACSSGRRTGFAFGGFAFAGLGEALGSVVLGRDRGRAVAVAAGSTGCGGGLGPLRDLGLRLLGSGGLACRWVGAEDRYAIGDDADRPDACAAEAEPDHCSHGGDAAASAGTGHSGSRRQVGGLGAVEECCGVVLERWQPPERLGDDKHRPEQRCAAEPGEMELADCRSAGGAVAQMGADLEYLGSARRLVAERLDDRREPLALRSRFDSFESAEEAAPALSY